MSDVFNIGSRRELFWDDFIIEKDRTTAKLTQHIPQKKELAIDLDKEWEGDGCTYFNYIKIDSIYRMYYVAGMIIQQGECDKRALCIIESKDGIHWERPNVGIHEYKGSYDNNIIMLQSDEDLIDNFFVFIDTNPACPPNEIIKAVAQWDDNAKQFPANRELWCYISSDGIRFTSGWKMTDGGVKNGGIFDSLNTAWWDEEKGCYVSFVRGLHDVIRDIRFMESKDFKDWSEPQLLNFGDGDDIPLYTNNASRYYRTPHMFIGFPSRYVCRDKWTKNLDLLGGEAGAKRRHERMRDHNRFGLTTTDCVFMTSRDGLNWNRFDEAIFSPELEHDENWVYGDCYPMYDMIETPCGPPFHDNEITMYMHEGHWSGKHSPLYRYSIRVDGFASYRATYQPCEITTKPFIFTGKELSINFRTSARGYIYVQLQDEFGKPIDGFFSCEMFGNSLDRSVYFGESNDVSKLAGKPIRMHILMSDADIYSFMFR